MKEIKLSNNRGITLVDDEDYENLLKYKWRINKGYARTSIKIYGKWKSKTMHRIIMDVSNKFQVDHIDNNRLNNQKNNLRIVTQQQNNMNRIKGKNCSSKYKGVSKAKDRNTWRAAIRFNKKYIHIGCFLNEKDAAGAYNDKARELFGKYANLNKI